MKSVVTFYSWIDPLLGAPSSRPPVFDFPFVTSLPFLWLVSATLGFISYSDPFTFCPLLNYVAHQSPLCSPQGQSENTIAVTKVLRHFAVAPGARPVCFHHPLRCILNLTGDTCATCLLYIRSHNSHCVKTKP